MSAFDGWENYYVIVGSSGGALIGLQFVVITLVADSPSVRNDAQVGGAFGTPSVVHFGSVLLLSAIVSAPWSGIGVVAVLWGLIGFLGMAYAAIVTRRLRLQTTYRPVGEDWLFHVVLPLASYATLAGSAFMARAWTRPALFLVGAAALLLLFVGIHNAWDAATYHIFVQRREQREAERRQESSK